MQLPTSASSCWKPARCTPRRWRCWRASRPATRAPVDRLHARSHEAVVQFVAREGKDAMYKSIALRKACCGIRKMEPLGRALAGKSAWITGLRREQSGARAEVPLIDTSDAGRVKFNPLANWTWGDVWHYIALNQVAYNPLHDQFYPQHRLRALHPRHQPGRRLPRRPLVVGRRSRQGMRPARQRSATCTSNNRESPRMNARTASELLQRHDAPPSPRPPEQRPPRRAGRRNHLHPARSGRRLRAPRPAVLGRQGLAGDAQVRRKGLWHAGTGGRSPTRC